MELSRRAWKYYQEKNGRLRSSRHYHAVGGLECLLLRWTRPTVRRDSCSCSEESKTRDGVRLHLVDLATGTCARQPDLLCPRRLSAAARLKDGRVVCAGGWYFASRDSAEVYGPPAQGAPDAPWTWTELPAMRSAGRIGCTVCVMSDGRFAVLGGFDHNYHPVSSCEALVLGDDDAPHWEPMPPMHEARSGSVRVTVAGSIIIAGGQGRKSAEVYGKVLDRWFRLRHDLPIDGTMLAWMGSALMCTIRLPRLVECDGSG